MCDFRMRCRTDGVLSRREVRMLRIRSLLLLPTVCATHRERGYSWNLVTPTLFSNRFLLAVANE